MRKATGFENGAKGDLLSEVEIVKNCPASWAKMRGDHKTRYCNQCRRNVYNLSGMTREEAIAFLEASGEQVCIRYYRRRDGTILTMPCGGVKRTLFKASAAMAALLAAVGFGAFLFTPVYAGARKMSPVEAYRFAVRNVNLYRSMLNEETDADARESLAWDLKEAKERARAAYARLTPEDLETLRATPR